MLVTTDFRSYSCDWIEVENYIADGSPAIMLWSFADGPIARITVCLDDKTLRPNEAYVDTNNCPWAPEWIEKNGFGEATGRTRDSGYCTYPAYAFAINRLLAHIRPERWCS